MANKVLFIGLVWPEPTSSAAGTRIIQLVNLFLSQGDEVHFASAAVQNQYSFDFGSQVTSHQIELNNSSFNAWIKKLEPNIVVFDRFVIEEQFGWRVQQECPNALRILDTEDLHFLRKGRQKSHDTPLLYNETAKREIASILRCDLSLIISEVEMDILMENFKIDKSILYYLPFLEEKISNSVIANWKTFEQRKDFVFIGNYLHEPNWQTLLYLKKEIWPVLSKALPNACLQIYGAYTTDKITQLHNEKQRFIVNGRAVNARETIASHRVLLAPLLFGAGIKGKLIDAMQTGTPTVTTSIGAEGMKGDLPWCGAVANGALEIAAQAAALYANKEVWITAQANAVAIINQRYDIEIFRQSFADRINGLLIDLVKHRQQNFIGQILNHHTLSSTKYMSLWIEEKNKIG